MQQLGSVYVPLLSALCAAAIKHNQVFTILRKVDPVTWPPVDNAFTNAREPLDARCVAQFHPQLGSDDLCGGLSIQTVEPAAVRAGAISPDVFLDADADFVMVTNMLPNVQRVKDEPITTVRASCVTR